MYLTVPMGRYCHSGPVTSNNSVLTKLSVICGGSIVGLWNCYDVRCWFYQTRIAIDLKLAMYAEIL